MHYLYLKYGCYGNATCYIYSQFNCLLLTHLSRMEFPNVIIGQVNFRFKGCLVVFFHFIQNLIEPSVSNSGEPDQTPRFAAFAIKTTLGLYGLSQ